MFFRRFGDLLGHFGEPNVAKDVSSADCINKVVRRSSGKEEGTTMLVNLITTTKLQLIQLGHGPFLKSRS